MVLEEGLDVGRRRRLIARCELLQKLGLGVPLFVLLDDPLVEIVVAVVVGEVGHGAIPFDRGKPPNCLSADQNCVKTRLFSRFSTLTPVVALNSGDRGVYGLASTVETRSANVPRELRVGSGSGLVGLMRGRLAR